MALLGLRVDFSRAAASGSCSPADHGLLLVWVLLLHSTGSKVQASEIAARGLSSWGSQAIAQTLNSCGAWASLLHSMWGLPGSGIEPMSPALAGGFLATEPPGKPSYLF